VDAFWKMKKDGLDAPPTTYDSIDVPPRSPNGFVTAFFAVVTGFALIWHITWMAILGLVCATVTLMVFGWIERVDNEISGSDLALAERPRSKASA